MASGNTGECEMMQKGEMILTSWTLTAASRTTQQQQMPVFPWQTWLNLQPTQHHSVEFGTSNTRLSVQRDNFQMVRAPVESINLVFFLRPPTRTCRGS